MKLFNNKFVVYSDLEKVWAFYTNIRHLEKITPPEMNLSILHTTSEEIKEGSETWIVGKIIFDMQWHSRIVVLEPYRYVDEMFVSGSDKPFFKYWRHEHMFKAGEGQTTVLDRIMLELPFGLAGRIFEGYAIKRLRNVFKYREVATKKQLEVDRYLKK
jgi:ligand-binding SRPBCC domain-containing protein